MIGVTIGIGEGWQQLAESKAARMAEMTGLECRVINVDDYGCAHPSWLKCHVHRIFPDEDSFLVFDADILPLRPWDPECLFESLGRPFIGVPEPNANPELKVEIGEWGLGTSDTYINGGLLIFGHEHGAVWDRVWSLHPHGGRWLEQTAINHALAMDAIEVCRLPRHFNLLSHRGKLSAVYARGTLANAVNLHTCAVGNAAEVEAIHQQFLSYIHSGNAGRTRQQMLARLPKGSVGAEIGVFTGDFSRDLLETVEPSKLHLVDLFQGIAVSGNVDGRFMRRADLAVVRKELAALDPRILTHAADSVEWLTALHDDALDWVYLDTTHEYGRTIAELEQAWRVVRPGGIIAGHDFSRAFPGVMQAVAEFVTSTGTTLELYDGDLLPSYFIQKPTT